MSRGFGYGSTEYRDEPSRGGPFRDNPFGNRGSNTGAGTSFNAVSDEISSNIFRVNSNATALDRAMRQIGTAKDSIELRDRIHSIEQSTNLLVSETASKFHHLAGSITRSDRNQKLQFQRLKNEFQETIQRYNVLQKKVAEKVKTSVILSSPSTAQKPQGPKGLIEWGDVTADEERQREEERRAQQQEQLQAQDQILEADLELLHERESRIQQLESDILDINEIFKDLATLVHEQGEMIDTIEDNVETAYSQVESGKDQLIHAERYQRKARKKLCCLVIIITVIAAILTLIIVLSLKH